MNDDSELEMLIKADGITFVTFPDEADPMTYFINTQEGNWKANLNAPQILQDIKDAQNEVPTYNARLKYILFGYGETAIHQFDWGFWASLTGKHLDPRHSLNEVRYYSITYSLIRC